MTVNPKTNVWPNSVKEVFHFSFCTNFFLNITFLFYPWFLFIFFIFTDWELCAIEWLGWIFILSILWWLILEMPQHEWIFCFFSLIAGSPGQSNIWSCSHDGHCWESNILPSNSCGSWPCAEQVSCSSSFYFTYFFSYGRKSSCDNWYRIFCVPLPVISVWRRIHQWWKLN